jgi:hypothetical protein
MSHAPADTGPDRIGRGLRRATVGLLLLLATGAAARPDYALLDEVLLYNVRNGYVDYDGIRAHPKFAEFLRQLGEPQASPAASREAELALYINAYNAFAIKGILDGYSPATRFGRYRYFKRREHRLAGESITLDALEHRRLRPLGDPRIHFAIVCASISCPRLASRAYLPETINQQLDEATQRFVNDHTRNRFDVALKTAFLSPIFDWFQEDFETNAGSVPGFLARNVQDTAVRAALLDGRLAIRYLPYDWELNGRFAGAAPE